MNQYNTLVEAVQDLKERGYVYDFNLDVRTGKKWNLPLSGTYFCVKEFYQFEGLTDPDHLSRVYAIETMAGVKGVLVQA